VAAVAAVLEVLEVLVEAQTVRGEGQRLQAWICIIYDTFL
jgi:hypothetical protein